MLLISYLFLIDVKNLTNLIIAVRDAAGSEHSCVRWQRLVDAGMTNTLCRCVIDSSMNLGLNRSNNVSSVSLIATLNLSADDKEPDVAIVGFHPLHGTFNVGIS